MTGIPRGPLQRQDRCTGPFHVVEVSKVGFFINSCIHPCQNPFPLILLLLATFEGTEVTLTGGKEEERHDECRKVLPDSVVSVSLFFPFAWKEQVVSTKLIGNKK